MVESKDVSQLKEATESWHLFAKTFRLERDGDLKKFREECELLESLHHRHIIAYFGSEEANGPNGTCKIFLEYCDMGPLNQTLFDPTIIYSINTVISWAKQLFDALCYLGSKNIVHSNLNPSTIFVTERFKLKLNEFQDAFYHDKHSELTFKTDIYGVGCILWTTVERRCPYTEQDEASDLLSLMDTATECLLDLYCVDELKDLIQNCLKLDPKKRSSAESAFRISKSLKESFRSIYQFDPRPSIDEDQSVLLKPIGFDGTDRRVKVIETKEMRIKNQKPLIESVPVDNMKPVENILPVDDDNQESTEKSSSTVSPFGSEFSYEEPDSTVEEIPITSPPDEVGGLLQSHEDSKKLDKDIKANLYLKTYLKENLMRELMKHSSALSEMLAFLIEAFNLYQNNAMTEKTILVILRESYRKEFQSLYVVAFISVSTQKKWVLVGDQKSNQTFLSSDLSQTQTFNGAWKSPELYIVNEEGQADEFHFHKLKILTYNLLLLSIETMELQCQEIALQRNQFYWSEGYFRSIRAQVEGLDLPFPGYVFQIRNPPKHICHHEVTCPLLGGFPRDIDSRFQVTYHACASQAIIDYLRLYVAVCHSIADFYWDDKLKLSNENALVDLNDLYKDLNINCFNVSNLQCPSSFLFFCYKTYSGKKELILDPIAIKTCKERPFVADYYLSSKAFHPENELTMEIVQLDAKAILFPPLKTIEESFFKGNVFPIDNSAKDERASGIFDVQLNEMVFIGRRVSKHRKSFIEDFENDDEPARDWDHSEQNQKISDAIEDWGLDQNEKEQEKKSEILEKEIMKDQLQSEELALGLETENQKRPLCQEEKCSPQRSANKYEELKAFEENIFMDSFDPYLEKIIVIEEGEKLDE